MSVRSIAMGCAIGTLFASGNVFTGLKIGFVDGGSMAAALLSFAIFSLFSPTRPYNKHETNISQAIAASAAIMGTVVGLSGPIAALDMIDRFPSATSLVLWGLALSFLGIGIAVWLREQLIERDDLPFPTGTATAEIIETAVQFRKKTVRNAIFFIATLVASAGFVGLRDGPSHIIPSATTFEHASIGVMSATIAIGFSWSPMISATGILIGIRGSLSLVFGSVIAWVGLIPHVANTQEPPITDYSSAASWLMWPSVALLLASSLTTLCFQWRSLVKASETALHWRTQKNSNRSYQSDRSDRSNRSNRSNRSGYAGIMVTLGSIIIISLAYFSFSINLMTVIVVLLATYVLTVFCARAAGETDIAPAGTAGTLGQFVGASPSPNTCLISGSIPYGVGSQAAQMLWTFKTGKILRTGPLDLVFSQCIGSIVGIASAIPTYLLIRKVYSLGSPELPATSALTWRATAEAITNGSSNIPESANLCILVAIFLGIAMTILNEKSRLYKRFLPTPVAMGIGAIMPATFSGAILIGTIGLLIAQRILPQGTRQKVLLLAAGAIAGESIAGVVIAILKSMNLF